ncbi:MAG: hypothetical protein HHJ15_18140 [Rhodoferax sp.]|uniref:hypothetical protein n=1 Tax=Rhodoferax sp. TaxID=50421 RepID=UPI0017D66893|nr:hypothetical protein [Rhodoferax sp.]NMM21843.1 hypothetical protein [Rhodoferax sp.]
MPVNNMSIGKDVSVVIITSTGSLNIPAAAITNFGVQPVTEQESRIGMDGVTRPLVVPTAWKGSFDVDRMNSSVEDWWASVEAAYFAGQNINSGTITETISNPDGSISQYRYTGVMFDLQDLGNREPTKVIKQKLSFVASRRMKA